jgi:hypothetical protein
LSCIKRSTELAGRIGRFKLGGACSQEEGKGYPPIARRRITLARYAPYDLAGSPGGFIAVPSLTLRLA